jgi:Pentose-5-phosphate-3-epimerase
MITKKDVACGISIKPNTPIEAILPFLNKIDLVLIMSVEPGFGGQKYMDIATDKITKLRKIIDEKGYECLIQVDGGINEHTSLVAKKAGADVLVAGSYIFLSKDIKKQLKI